MWFGSVFTKYGSDTMVKIHQIGKTLGKGLGTITGKPVEFIGKKVNSDFVQGVGKSMAKASEHSGDLLGQFTDGVYHSAAGALKDDPKQKSQGISNLKDSGQRTWSSVKQTATSVYTDGKDVYQGYQSGDRERMIRGAKHLGQTAAVMTFAVSVFEGIDALDGGGKEVSAAEVHVDHADGTQQVNDGTSNQAVTEMPNQQDVLNDIDENGKFHTINEDLNGQAHPVTGVEYIEKDIVLPNGLILEDGVYPDFQYTFDVQLSNDMHFESDSEQFTYANQQLWQAINQDPDLYASFNEVQYEQIMNGETPDGYVWHHAEEPGRLELVDEEVHNKSGHTGGRFIWGGGSDFR